MTPRGAGAESAREFVLHGEPAAPGIGVAPAMSFERLTVPVFRLEIGESEVGKETRRFDEALERSAKQLRQIRESTRRALGEDPAWLFEAQRLMLEDPRLVDQVRSVIRSERVNAEWALRTVLRELEVVFDGLADDYLRERKGDIMDVGGRLLRNLAGGPQPVLSRRPKKHVVVAEDLRPSDTDEIDWSRTAGVVMEAGGPTYHTAILARTHDVPCVTGVSGLLRHLRVGKPVIVDGSEGTVIVNASEERVAEYQARRDRILARRRRLRAQTAAPAKTADGQRVTLMANMDEPGEIELVRQNGAEGVGLFRTEHLAAHEIPTEEEQYRIYRDLAGKVDPHPLVIRAFDLDAKSVGRSREQNPALGLRGTRLLVTASVAFENQIRAVLRAAAHGNIQFMFPMVGGLEEFRAARTHVRAAIRVLRHRRIPFREVPVGAMLEVPSAAATADLLTEEAEFLSIGTNDLMQYLFGADRANERVAHFNDALHPALLRTVRFVARAARRAGVPLAVCGEVAAEPLVIPLLLGFGLRTFSMSPNAIPEVKERIAALDTGEAEEIAQQSVRLKTARRVRARILRLQRGGRAEPSRTKRPPSGS